MAVGTIFSIPPGRHSSDNSQAYSADKNCFSAALSAIAEYGLLRDPFARESPIGFFTTLARYESQRRSERTRAGLARRKAEGLPIGRRPGATDKKPRKRSGYLLETRHDPTLTSRPQPTLPNTR
jgi:hypothetical protein